MREYAWVITELGRRVARIVADNSHGLDKPSREDLTDAIQDRVISLILEPTLSKKGEFLEIAFRRVVQGLTLNAVERVFRELRERPVVHLGDAEDQDGDRSDPWEAVGDDRPSPDQVVERRRLAEGALHAVTDPLHREAVVLRYVYGWPFTAQEPATPTLCNHFQKSERQIRNWLNAAVHQMRSSTGEDS